MIYSWVPVLLLATVALSSSNILPILSMDEEHYGQTNDNTFSKHQTKDELGNVLLKIVYDNEKPTYTHEFNSKERFDAENKAFNSLKDNYDVKGFRKEQWHNYPRQLDRLNKYLYEDLDNDKRNLDPDDTGEPEDYGNLDEGPNDMSSNENIVDSFEPLRSIDEVNKAAAIMNPLIVLKIHLACLNKNKEFDKFPEGTTQLEDVFRAENNYREDDPKLSVMKVKREGKVETETAESAQSERKNRMVNKRIFSLWSRLQSLNHKGHELHHRRHLYALYGLPDSDGGSSGVLTAETRATFLRPPGSPLRWG